jgi:hypothetical protein
MKNVPANNGGQNLRQDQLGQVPAYCYHVLETKHASMSHLPLLSLREHQDDVQHAAHVLRVHVLQQSTCVCAIHIPSP